MQERMIGNTRIIIRDLPEESQAADQKEQMVERFYHIAYTALLSQMAKKKANT